MVMLFDRHDRASLFDRVSRGILAGAIGGLVGGGMKLIGEWIFPPRAPGEPVPPVVAVSKLTDFFSGSPLLPQREVLATQIFHFSFSVGAGMIYGALAERYPKVRFGHGIAFGLLLCLATHESLLPALGLSLPLGQIPLKEHISELSTHALFGISVEVVRRLFRERVVNGHLLTE